VECHYSILVLNNIRFSLLCSKI